MFHNLMEFYGLLQGQLVYAFTIFSDRRDIMVTMFNM
jgi:hypothetical protein